MFRKSVAVFACFGLVSSISNPTPSRAETRIAAPEGGFCRTPSALPDLGEEPQFNQQQTETRKRERSEPTPASPAPPPPPPSTSDVAADDDGMSIVVTGSRAEETVYDSPVAVSSVSAEEGSSSADRVAPPGIMPSPPPDRPQPRPQSGLLTAGEHDDLLNPELYADYVRKSDLGQMQMQLPKLDTSRLLTVSVADRRGRAVPFAEVELRCSDGNSIKLKTVADGKVVFFPELDRLSETVWVRAAGSDWRSLRLSNERGGQSVKITSRSSAPKVTKLDLALVVDATGSMADEMLYLTEEFKTIVGALEERHKDLDIRVGLTFYRDTTDQYITRTYGFDEDMNAAQARIAAQEANGGGDYPEAMDQALIRAAGLEWRDDSVKSLLLVADAPPHNNKVDLTWKAAEHLRAKRVHIVPVGASGVADLAEYVMRSMAVVSQSRYTFLTDDSGIGNPHAEPAIDCYLVTRLDQLLRRVIDSQISGRRIEPKRSEVIRTVGQYEAGKCVLPPDFGQQ
ncbi:VWA domain-containing protein [uncultured Erythrobacter sp.]|uniref:vWA domain-containing protein n=1 Tax=uncultured Erythrobacter sp. TaxID=263913 RepID=UPI0026354978|nr:vWA domain-containing protein [uncultured Erythrobacter sp.]